jgi:hypothetical protein
MAATMPNPDDNHQSLNDAAHPYEEPAWLKPVKVASVVMGVLIVLALALLGYGLSTGMGKLAQSDGQSKRFTHPAGMTLTGASTSGDGVMTMMFQDATGQVEVVTINPSRGQVLNRLQLQVGQEYRFDSN